MVISPEGYYEEYLKGRNKVQIFVLALLWLLLELSAFVTTHY